MSVSEMGEKNDLARVSVRQTRDGHIRAVQVGIRTQSQHKCVIVR